MKIVIDIHEKDYQAIKSGYLPFGAIAYAIVNGTPLPEHHGRLIDADNISFSQFFDAGDYAQARRGIYEAPTIIKSDKEEE